MTGQTIGDYTAAEAQPLFKYSTDANNSGTLHVSAVNIDNTLTWNTYAIAGPTGSTSTFLRNDGTWATPSGGGGGGGITQAQAEEISIVFSIALGG
jgi:hypothetical protein